MEFRGFRGVYRVQGLGLRVLLGLGFVGVRVCGV